MTITKTLKATALALLLAMSAGALAGCDLCWDWWYSDTCHNVQE
ncbi:MAG: hypothetical protein ACR2PJ_03550 [Pseudomonadales bacterium]